MKHKNNQCLVLNADYTVLTIVDWKKAFIWYYKYNNTNYNIEIIDFYKDDCIYGVQNKKYPIPAVAKIKKYYKCSNQNVNFSRKNIFVRDNYTCQYCGVEKTIASLTYDHVIPKSMWNYHNGSPTTWTNIVTACTECNRKKGNRTPKQANMPILNAPYKPNKNQKYLPVHCQLARIGMGSVPDEWKIYITNSIE